MVRFKPELGRWVRSVMLAHGQTHGLVGVRDVDEQILDEALVKFDGGLRLFHMHAEGMGLVIIATTTVAATFVASPRASRAIVALLTVGGAGYPLGYLVWSVLIPYYGIERGKTLAEWLCWIPFGGVTIVAMWWLAGMLAVRMLRVSGFIALALILGAGAPAAAHHVGAYSARDNDVSANFKQIKFSIQAGKTDVALQLFDAGALRKEMQARATRLPAGLESSTRAALTAGDAKTAELDLAVFFAALARDLALEADRKLAELAPVDAQAAAGVKFLEAIWRYYNLVDFAISERNNRTAVGVRLAFEEAEGYAKGTAKPATAPDPGKMRAPLQRLAQILSDFIRSSTDKREPRASGYSPPATDPDSRTPLPTEPRASGYSPPAADPDSRSPLPTEPRASGYSPPAADPGSRTPLPRRDS